MKQRHFDPANTPSLSSVEEGREDEQPCVSVATGILTLTRDPVARELLMEIALDGGLGLCAVGDSAEAVRILDTQPPALVVVDLDASDGRALLRMLREQERWRSIPLFALTANNNPMETVTIDAPVFFKPDLEGLEAAVAGRFEATDHGLSDDLSRDLSKLGNWPRRTPSA